MASERPGQGGARLVLVRDDGCLGQDGSRGGGAGPPSSGTLWNGLIHGLDVTRKGSTKVTRGVFGLSSWKVGSADPRWEGPKEMEMLHLRRFFDTCRGPCEPSLGKRSVGELSAYRRLQSCHPGRGLGLCCLCLGGGGSSNSLGHVESHQCPRHTWVRL